MVRKGFSGSGFMRMNGAETYVQKLTAINHEMVNSYENVWPISTCIDRSEIKSNLTWGNNFTMK